MSSAVKGFLKSGWHPENEGTTLKGQMKSLVGRGDKNNKASTHVVRPMSSLRDPGSFAPPPKRVDSASACSVYQPPHQKSEEEEPPSPKPYQTDTTGRSTTHIPPPPPRTDGFGGVNRVLAPPPYSPSASASMRSGPPALPPRLPPRSVTQPTATDFPYPSLPNRTSTPDVAPHSGSSNLLNQNFIDRLGAAGVSVPSLGIGQNASPPTPMPPAVQKGGQLSELQYRFGKLSTGSSPSPTPPSQGTTFTQKREALRTADALRRGDTSKVTFSDARNAASTLNNFRQRHGEQVAAGIRTAGQLNEKYDVASKVSGFTGQGQRQGNEVNSAAAASPGLGAPAGFVTGKKKPPPPPPLKKKLDLAGGTRQSKGLTEDDEPPPIPFASRPRF